MRSRWISHRGKRVFYADYSQLGTDIAALRTELQAVVETLTHEPPNSVVVLNDVRGTVATAGTTALLRDTVNKTNLYVRRRAVIGLSGVRRGLLDVINRFTGQGKIRAFDEQEQALEWLIAE